jgi:hypothetical protein
MKLVGYSLSGCLRSIVATRIALDDVVFIVSSTAYADRADMIQALSSSMMGPDRDTHLANARILWDTGRIYQPSARPSVRRAMEIIWREALPEEIAMDEGVRQMNARHPSPTRDETPAEAHSSMVETAILHGSGQEPGA